MHETARVIWRIRKSRADSAAQSRESYMKDSEKIRADIAARSREIYEKDLEKGRYKMKLAWLYPTKVTKQLQS